MSGNPSIFPGRDTIASKLADLDEANKALIADVLEKGEHDDLFIEGLYLFLDQQSKARFLNSLKLNQTGEWLGAIAPDRLQMRIMEAARSSQHGAYNAFREGLASSGGLDRAYPQSPV